MTVRKFAWAIPLLAAFLLPGCVSTPPMVTRPLHDNEAMIAPDVTFAIPPPSVLGQTVSVAQVIVAHFRDQSYSFQAQIQITPQQLDLAALDGLGRRALTVTWKQDGIDHKEAPWLPAFIRPADILADIAIVYWPEEIVASSLASSGTTLSVSESDRKIRSAKRDLIVVEYGEGKGWNRAAKLRNLVFGYEIDIQSSEIAP